MMTKLSSDIALSITDTLEHLVAPSQRIYWPFLLSSVAIALLVLFVKREKLRSFFAPRVWMHPSAQMDYRLLLTNAFIKTALWGSIVVSALAVVIFTDGVLRSLVGDVDVLHWSAWEITVLYTLVLFVGLDGSRFLMHRLMHKIPLLWHFHQVHHSAEVLTPLTVYRVHPVESFLYGMRGALTTGVITGVFWFLFNGQASQAELLGVNAVGLVLNALGANLRHSHVWLSYGVLEAIFISPAQHQMHHGIDPNKAQVNYGAFLSIWDRLGNSLSFASEETQPVAFGLPSNELNHKPDSVLSAYFAPLRACAGDLASRARDLSPTPATSLLALTAMQCSSDPSLADKPDARSDSFDRAALVSNLSQNVIVPSYENALSSTQAMSGALDTYCLALGNADEMDKRALVQDAWKLAMTSWQEAELSSIGPASPNSLALRDFIYSWPITNACAVDQDVMLAVTDAAYDISQAQLNRRGLDALEYLLFNDNLDSVCPPQVTPVGWAGLSGPEKTQARCQYSQLVTVDLSTQQSSLISAWTSAGGYLENLNSAGGSSSDFDSPQEAINEIFAGLFYLELVTKDAKAGGTAGVTTNDCNVVNEPCLQMLESSYAKISKENILANLSAFEKMVRGEGGLGFADFLVGVDASATADRLRTAIDAAIAAYEALNGSLEEGLTGDYQSTRDAYDALRGVTDILKNDMPGILQLDIPQSAGGDSD
ncbi:MAG: sterol desaturase family protein [Kofleriaceae bacterium]|nr:sterol desaturase family protein [Kofleriaceae bacterium]